MIASYQEPRIIKGEIDLLKIIARRRRERPRCGGVVVSDQRDEMRNGGFAAADVHLRRRLCQRIPQEVDVAAHGEFANARARRRE